MVPEQTGALVVGIEVVLEFSRLGNVVGPTIPDGFLLCKVRHEFFFHPLQQRWRIILTEYDP